MGRGRWLQSASARALALVFTLGVAGPALAQVETAPPAPNNATTTPALTTQPEASPPPAPSEDETSATSEVEEVVVTGSLIAGLREDAPIPIQVISQEELENRGSPTAVDLVKSLNVVGGVVAGEFNRFNLYPVNFATVNLRGLGANRTVVLFNGRRFAEQFGAQTGRATNINQIPNAAIGRVEIVTEGGATTYGADAVGGVINYITRSGFDGLEVTGFYRAISDSDGDYGADILWGRKFDNGDALVSVSWDNRSQLLARDRDWADRPYLENNTASTWSAASNPGAYTFDVAGATPGTFTSITNTAAAVGNRYVGDRQMGVTGVVRDPACAAVGGFAGWNAAVNPVCYFQVESFDELATPVSTYNVYGELNFDLAENLRFHGELGYYASTVDAATHPSDANFAGLGLPREGFFSVSGANPAVAALLGQTTNSNGTTAFTAAQIAAITSGGRVRLSSWRPFAQGGNPLFGERDRQKIDTKQFRIAGALQGELPEFMGTEVSYDAGLTYTRTYYNQRVNDMLVDRLQNALNGLGGFNCNGIRAGLPGSTCQWFNPFSSGVAENIYRDLPNPYYVGTGNYAGYTPGQGLQNDPNLVRWLYTELYGNRYYDQFAADVVFKAQTGIELPGGPVALAAGAQYRYNRVTEESDPLSNLNTTPCSPINIVPPATTCTGSGGNLVFGRQASVHGVSRAPNTREYPVVALFGEANLPILDRLTLSAAGRYEKFYSDLTDVHVDVFVPSVSAKYQVLDWVAVRGTWGETFQQISPPRDDPATIGSQATTVSSVNGSFNIGGLAEPTFNTANYPNVGVQPETGTNYNVGVLFNVGNFRANIDYFNIQIEDYARTLTVGNVVSALVQPGAVGPNALINCSSPLLQPQEGLGGNPYVRLNGPCVQGTSTLTSASGGLASTVAASRGTVSYFGGTRQVNGGTFQTSGLDMSASYTFEDVLGGRLTLSADATQVLEYTLSDFLVFGVKVANGYDGVGFLNVSSDRGTGPVSEWRGSVGANFRLGRHNLNVTTRFASSLINDSLTLFTETPALNANIGDAAGQIACPATDPNPQVPPNPNGAGSATYGSDVTLTPTQIATGYCAFQNYVNNLGREIPNTTVTDVTYRVDLPWDSTLTLSVFNLLNDDPEFNRAKFSYDTSTGSPLGRNVKIQFVKRF